MAIRLHHRGRTLGRLDAGTVLEQNSVRPPSNSGIGLNPAASEASMNALQQLLADTIALRDLYQRHWPGAGLGAAPPLCRLREMFDTHYAEQAALAEEIASRIELLGTTSSGATAPSRIEGTPHEGEGPAVQIARMLAVHAAILREARLAASGAGQTGCAYGLLAAEIVRTNELHVWFLAEHLEALSAADQAA